MEAFSFSHKLLLKNIASQNLNWILLDVCSDNDSIVYFYFTSINNAIIN